MKPRISASWNHCAASRGFGVPRALFDNHNEDDEDQSISIRRLMADFRRALVPWASVVVESFPVILDTLERPADLRTDFNERRNL